MAGCALVLGIEDARVGPDPAANDATVELAPPQEDALTSSDSAREAAADAGLDVTVDACGANIVFCSSFEDGPLPEAWDGVTRLGDGSVVLSGGGYDSATALLSEIEPGTGTARMFVTAHVPVPPDVGFELTFRVRMPDLMDAAMNPCRIASLHLVGDDAGEEIVVSAHHSKVELKVTGRGTVAGDALPMGEWIGVRLSVEPQPAKPLAEVAFFEADATTVLVRHEAGIARPDGGYPMTHIQIGLQRFPSDTTPAMSVRFDDVRLLARPLQ